MQTSATEIISTLTTLRDYVRWASSEFTRAQISFGQGTVSALDEAAALVLHTLRQPYNLSEAYFDCVLTLTERQAVFDIVNRRINERLPAAYLTNESIFAGRYSNSGPSSSSEK